MCPTLNIPEWFPIVGFVSGVRVALSSRMGSDHSPALRQLTAPSQASQQVGLSAQIGPFRGRLKRVTGGHHI